MSNVYEVWHEGVLVESADDSAREVTTWVEGVPTVRPYTVEEDAAAGARVAGATREGNAGKLGARVEAALAANSTIITSATTYLAIADTATAGQVRDQVKALTQAARAAARQRNALIRLLTGRLDDISDTD